MLRVYDAQRWARPSKARVCGDTKAKHRYLTYDCLINKFGRYSVLPGVHPKVGGALNTDDAICAGWTRASLRVRGWCLLPSPQQIGIHLFPFSIIPFIPCHLLLLFFIYSPASVRIHIISERWMMVDSWNWILTSSLICLNGGFIIFA